MISIQIYVRAQHNGLTFFKAFFQDLQTENNSKHSQTQIIYTIIFCLIVDTFIWILFTTGLWHGVEFERTIYTKQFRTGKLLSVLANSDDPRQMETLTTAYTKILTLSLSKFVMNIILDNLKYVDAPFWLHWIATLLGLGVGNSIAVKIFPWNNKNRYFETIKKVGLGNLYDEYISRLCEKESARKSQAVMLCSYIDLNANHYIELVEFRNYWIAQTGFEPNFKLINEYMGYDIGIEKFIKFININNDQQILSIKDTDLDSNITLLKVTSKISYHDFYDKIMHLIPGLILLMVENEKKRQEIQRDINYKQCDKLSKEYNIDVNKFLRNISK